MIQANVQQIHDVASALAAAVGQIAEAFQPLAARHQAVMAESRSQAVNGEVDRSFNWIDGRIRACADTLNELSAQMHQAANLLEEADRAGRGR